MFRTLRLFHSQARATALLNPRRYAGHNKWSNIKHIKAEKDSERAVLFARIRRAMIVAIQVKGSADPAVNTLLAQAIDQAKKANMPAASIQSVLKSAQEKKREQFRTLEIKGPNGVALIICIVTANFQIVKQNINSILKKSNGVFSHGTLLHQFKQKGIIKTDLLPNMSLEDAVNHAVQIDIDDVEEKDDAGDKYLEFSCQAAELEKKKKQLEGLNYIVRSAEIAYNPIALISVEEDVVKSINWLYEKLHDVPDIVNIYDNILES